MKQFLVVLRYELRGHFQNKVYRLSTLLVALIAIVGLSFPTINNLLKGESKSSTDIEEESHSTLTGDYILVDENEYLKQDVLNLFCLDCTMKKVTTQKEAEELIETTDTDFKAVFVVTSPTSYKYIVKNQSFSMFEIDEAPYMFDAILSYQYQVDTFGSLDIDYHKVSEVMNTSIEKEEIILGKDARGSYWSTYVLIFALYMMVLLYGQNIAVAVASEKSNRAIEILVTSASSNALIFGKVIAGAIASIIQFVVIVTSATLAYQYNYDAWNGALDVVFKIPTDVLITFGVFGVLGYLFYSFIYGAFGAMVQKSEEVNSSTIPITIIYLMAFFATYFGMAMDANGMVLKIASYLPFSSFMAMFTRLSMGSVAPIEIIISLAILVGTTLLVGVIAAKIYRMGTLMYGNKIKFSTVFKQLKNEK